MHVHGTVLKPSSPSMLPGVPPSRPRVLEQGRFAAHHVPPCPLPQRNAVRRLPVQNRLPWPWPQLPMRRCPYPTPCYTRPLLVLLRRRRRLRPLSPRSHPPATCPRSITIPCPQDPRRCCFHAHAPSQHRLHTASSQSPRGRPTARPHQRCLQAPHRVGPHAPFHTHFDFYSAYNKSSTTASNFVVRFGLHPNLSASASAPAVPVRHQPLCPRRMPQDAVRRRVGARARVFRPPPGTGVATGSGTPGS